MKIHFIANSYIGNSAAGGDFHLIKMAKAVVNAGYDLNFFGGHALQSFVKKNDIPATCVLTDEAASSNCGKLSTFHAWYKRYRRTMLSLDSIGLHDGAYAVSDYWCDALPVAYSKARRKVMVLFMQSPSIRQALVGRRPDVVGNRVSSLHYAISQRLSLMTLARHGGKLWEAKDCHGVESETADSVPKQERTYDAIWVGRISPQKGINDLLSTLEFLNQRLENFHAVLVGNLQDLEAEIGRLGLDKCVVLTGRVSEMEKFRLLKSSRVFLLTSYHEGLPCVASESIISNTPVVAYGLPHYEQMFGRLIHYVPPFKLQNFKLDAERVISAMREGLNPLARMEVDRFKREHSWETIQNKFIQIWKESDEVSIDVPTKGPQTKPHQQI
jgi:glycosyltransferase involved in cell wall biosynthesis